jgi:cysteine-rich repeat protein
MAKSRPRFAPKLSSSALVSMVSVVAMTAAACTPDRLPPPRCGDGNIDIPEVCDDANAMIGDGCNTLCQLEPNAICTGEPSVCRTSSCGDSITDPPEVCDEGRETDICNDNCTLSRCGDMIVNEADNEDCDDGNMRGGDGCSQDCQDEPASCGNGTCDTTGTPAETCTNCMVDCMPLPMCNGCPDDDDDGYFASRCGGNDCDDANAMVHPDATEVLCNRINEDCDGTTSDTRDADMDGFNCLLDCDDTSALASPANRSEICGDGVDNDCNSMTTEDADNDMDGFSCAVDCNDINPAVRPGTPEICNNGLNDDCDRGADGMPLAAPTRDVFDVDGDGAYCNADCNDMSTAVRPGLPEITCNMVDDDCNPVTTDGPDVDRDGATCSLDCDDNDARRSTLLREICGNGIDDDCNAMTADSGDSDGDTFDCSVDCDDTDPLVFPDAVGRCGARFTYSESFEMCPADWVTSGMASSWACGAPRATFIPAAATGTNAWVTNLAGAYSNNELSYLTSPTFNMSALRSDPQLSFNHIFQTETFSDEGWLEMSRDGGTTWTKVGASGQGVNWYTNATSQWWSGNTGTAGVWRPAAIRLVGAAGNANVRLRFVFSSDGSVTFEGFGVDDIRIDNQLIDATVSSITLTGSECGPSVDVSVVVTNTGVVNLPGFDVNVSVDGGAPTTRNVPIALAAGATRTVTIPGVAMSSGMRSIVATVVAAGDEVAANDSRTLSTVRPPTVVVTAAGYIEGFETDAGGWSSSAATGPNSWARGMPTGTFINRAAAGSFAWVTNPAGAYVNNENSFVTSPCLDLSALTVDPTLTFQHIFETESCCDEGWIEVWTSAGGWQRLGASGSGMNWYNNAASRQWNGTSGSAGAWRTASFPLASTAGQIIRIRHAFSSDGSVVEDGFGIDAVEIRP